MNTDLIAEVLLRKEAALLDSSVEDYKGVLSCLIDDEFIETGSSGKIYNKEKTIEVLLRSGHNSIGILDPAVRVLAEDLFLLTFRADSGKGVVVRNSIWRRTGIEWKIIFHQGTPVTI